ncbi:hypothetical protein [Paenibacillus sp. V4I5]|uniref:hypothetical protein n=1 Tax=Paenibacillus sp. V4I5 TaxID=3042306 RepID=UPI00278DFD6A|nr:hypothetical protein [Paenibacillus sp. V4I5]MDQ0916113.1 hypothetical protein [Paenibacillus sp. V4I5]
MFTANELDYLESLSGVNPIQQDIDAFKQKGDLENLEETGFNSRQIFGLFRSANSSIRPMLK